jgi:SMC interacting uncharacterized protein involved in chromosome segregation
MNEHKTFEELERLAYMSNLPKIAKLYAQLDDNEGDEYKIERLKSKIDDLEFQCNKQKVTLEKIEDIINE